MLAKHEESCDTGTPGHFTANEYTCAQDNISSDIVAYPIKAAMASAHVARVYDAASSLGSLSSQNSHENKCLDKEAIFPEQDPKKIEESICKHNKVIFKGKYVSSPPAVSEKPSARSDESGITHQTTTRGYVHVLRVPIWGDKRIASAEKYAAFSDCSSTERNGYEHKRRKYPTKKLTGVATLGKIRSRLQSMNKKSESESGDSTRTTGLEHSFDTGVDTSFSSDQLWLRKLHLPRPRLPSTASSSVANSARVGQILLEDEETFKASSLPCPFDWTCPRSSVQDKSGATMDMIYYEEVEGPYA